MARRTFGQGECIVLDQGAIDVQADGHHQCLVPIPPATSEKELIKMPD